MRFQGKNSSDPQPDEELIGRWIERAFTPEEFRHISGLIFHCRGWYNRTLTILRERTIETSVEPSDAIPGKRQLALAYADSCS